MEHLIARISDWQFSKHLLDGVGATFAGSNSDAVVQRQDKYFAIANLSVAPGSSSFDESRYGAIDELFVDRDLKLNFAAKVARQFVGIDHRSMALLTPKSLAIHYRQPEHFDLAERIFNRVQVVWLDDCDNQFHGIKLIPERLIPEANYQLVSRDLALTQYKPDAQASELSSRRNTLACASG